MAVPIKICSSEFEVEMTPLPVVIDEITQIYCEVTYIAIVCEAGIIISSKILSGNGIPFPNLNAPGWQLWCL